MICSNGRYDCNNCTNSGKFKLYNYIWREDIFRTRMHPLYRLNDTEITSPNSEVSAKHSPHFQVMG